MPVIEDDDQERLDRIEATLEKLRDELAAVREERRVVAENMADHALKVEGRARKRRRAAEGAQTRAEERAHRQAATTTHKKR